MSYTLFSLMFIKSFENQMENLALLHNLYLYIYVWTHTYKVMLQLEIKVAYEFFTGNHHMNGAPKMKSEFEIAFCSKTNSFCTQNTGTFSSWNIL